MSDSGPRKRIHSQTDLDQFSASPARRQLVAFVQAVADAITGFPNSFATTPSPAVAAVARFLAQCLELVSEVPPIHQPMRFGNKAFRIWKQRMLLEIPALLDNLVPATAVADLTHYLSESFGNDTRIDYGTGHELNMVVFLLCLARLGALQTSDLRDVGLVLFVAYIRVMRRLQLEYVLEPAGSHGVWGLDDYHCLLFVLGSAQLRAHPSILPSSVLDDAVLAANAEEFIYLEGIQFILKVKHTAPLAETSPMLCDISQLADWQRVHAGLVRLFEGEVLGKLPVVQHLYFGSVFECTWTSAHDTTAHSVTAADPFVTKAPWAK